MASRKSKPRFNQPQAQYQASDYETDTNNIADLVPPPPSRSNEALNLSVIRRYDSSVESILSIAPHVVVYVLSPETQSWGDTGIAGTLFVCQLVPSDIGAARYSLVVLNRRGLENFHTELSSGDDVEITDEFVILQVRQTEAEEPQIYGLWIFAEPPPASTAQARLVNAQLIENCAKQAEASRKLAEEQRLQASGSLTYDSPGEEQARVEEEEGSVPMGRQLSLRELFGQQREQDAGFSIRHHSSPPPKPAQFATTADTDFFRTTQRHAPPKQVPQPRGTASSANVASQSTLLDLFKRAKQGYHANG